MYNYRMIKDGAKVRTYEYEYNGHTGTTTSKVFPCIGGPFDQQYVSRIDIQIAELHDEYVTYNRAYGNVPQQVFVHKSRFPCL